MKYELQDPLSSLEDVFSERSLSTAITWIQEHWYYSLSALAAVVTLIVMFKVRVSYLSIYHAFLCRNEL